MDLNIHEVARILAETANRFLTEHPPRLSAQNTLLTKSPYQQHMWHHFAEMGWLSLPFSEFSGGLDGDPITIAMLMRSLGRHLAVEPYLSSILLAGGLLETAATEQQRTELLPDLITGDAIYAFAHQEGNFRHTTEVMHTHAKRQQGGWRLFGSKSMVLNGPAAKYFLVSARIAGNSHEREGIGVFLIPEDAKGLKQYPKRLSDGTWASNISMEGVSIGQNALLGGRDNMLCEIEASYDRVIAYQCAAATGVAESLLDSTVDYLQGRRQFGRPLASFQALQHRLADMKILSDEFISISFLALASLGSTPLLRGGAISSAKVKGQEALGYIARQSIQMHGGMGVTDELPIGKYFKWTLIFEQLLGTTEFHKTRYVRFLHNMSNKYKSWPELVTSTREQ